MCMLDGTDMFEQHAGTEQGQVPPIARLRTWFVRTSNGAFAGNLWPCLFRAYHFEEGTVRICFPCIWPFIMLASNQKVM